MCLGKGLDFAGPKCVDEGSKVLLGKGLKGLGTLDRTKVRLGEGLEGPGIGKACLGK